MWEEISFLKRSRNSEKILKALETPKTPSEVRKEIGIHLSAASRALLKLEKLGCVKCLTPKADKFRIYSITKKGRGILKKTRV